MASLLSSLSARLRRVYEKAEGFIGEEREIPVSQVFLNATFKRYITDNLSFLDDLHADLYDGWLRLYATLEVKGIHLKLSVDLKLIQMEFNKDVQLLVFDQISETQVIEARFKNVFQKWALNCALFFFRKVLRKDPLGPILQHFDVVEERDDLLFLDLNQFLGDKRSIIETLSKVHINHAELKDAELVVLGNVNLIALFNRSEDDFETSNDPVEQKLEESESHITPIRQK